jgi:hypothetical protein
MSRYFVRGSTHSFLDDVVHVADLSVDGGGPVKTGLLDFHGEPIYRAADPVGFVTEFKPRIRVKAISEPLS